MLTSLHETQLPQGRQHLISSACSSLLDTPREV